ncbi:MAG: hypothetical protein Solumvirus2_49 [Solumvirus sp.]|uniref:Uncharacterized protein n=1 Tax=Solumvirus sp. TaxID=2487773 RepID=A0A3G5AGE1_9VIRU|nr:MAG: hypothetical protein Solumvirus2_49 [Solumvirus sp.]
MNNPGANEVNIVEQKRQAFQAFDYLQFSLQRVKLEEKKVIINILPKYNSSDDFIGYDYYINNELRRSIRLNEGLKYHKLLDTRFDQKLYIINNALGLHNISHPCPPLIFPIFPISSGDYHNEILFPIDVEETLKGLIQRNFVKIDNDQYAYCHGDANFYIKGVTTKVYGKITYNKGIPERLMCIYEEASIFSELEIEFDSYGYLTSIFYGGTNLTRYYFNMKQSVFNGKGVSYRGNTQFCAYDIKNNIASYNSYNRIDDLYQSWIFTEGTSVIYLIDNLDHPGNINNSMSLITVNTDKQNSGEFIVAYSNIGNYEGPMIISITSGPRQMLNQNVNQRQKVKYVEWYHLRPMNYNQYIRDLTDEVNTIELYFPTPIRKIIHQYSRFGEDFRKYIETWYKELRPETVNYKVDEIIKLLSSNLI